MTHTLSPAPEPAIVPVDTERVADLISQLLVALGEDPRREGLVQTPDRVAAWYRDFLTPDSANAATCFPETRLDGQLVVVAGMSLWSLCEHHLLPMHLTTMIGYIPSSEVLGLSKFGRIAQRCAGRLQVQERFTRQLADEICEAVDHQDVAVAITATHLCMSMRGVRLEAARTTTLERRGRFNNDADLTQHFLTLAQSA